jgi:hypothetical protein
MQMSDETEWVKRNQALFIVDFNRTDQGFCCWAVGKEVLVQNVSDFPYVFVIHDINILKYVGILPLKIEFLCVLLTLKCFCCEYCKST